MATTTFIPVEEYLHTSYRPDVDYIDGVTKERHVGTRPHAALQSLLTLIFLANRRSWGYFAFTEQRVQVRPHRFRVPDVCVLSVTDPAGDIVTVPPLLCIEVLSPDDALLDMQERADDYIAMGIDNIWIFDPVGHRAWRVTTNGFERVLDAQLGIAGTAIDIILADLFTELDELTRA